MKKNKILERKILNHKYNLVRFIAFNKVLGDIPNSNQAKSIVTILSIEMLFEALFRTVHKNITIFYAKTFDCVVYEKVLTYINLKHRTNMFNKQILLFLFLLL